ncbi:hypothetical protein ZHAS_00005787 [Anopheles sinensis]|uniref:Uncharacterized protein n=1 Tax=Anopheles sinensis TaxID=74873 RepID=A0A084VKD0_ANOSI|nr:hypothetical protein ZHAS_00005787 [Anopheles sinensis]
MHHVVTSALPEQPRSPVRLCAAASYNTVERLRGWNRHHDTNDAELVSRSSLSVAREFPAPFHPPNGQFIGDTVQHPQTAATTAVRWIRSLLLVPSTLEPLLGRLLHITNKHGRTVRFWCAVGPFWCVFKW